jgi:hypothetical protein
MRGTGRAAALELIPELTDALGRLRNVDVERIRAGIDAPASPTKATRELYAIRRDGRYDHLFRVYAESWIKQGWRKPAELVWTFSGWRAAMTTDERTRASRSVHRGQSGWVDLDPHGNATAGTDPRRPFTLDAAARARVLRYDGYTPGTDESRRYAYETDVADLYNRTIALIAGYLAQL